MANPPQDQFGVNLTNSAFVIKNGDPLTIAYGMVADRGPHGHLGEVSRKMMDELGFSGAAPTGDYFVVMFPQKVSNTDKAKEKEVSAIQNDAKAAFEAWTWEGRSGIDLIKELFPTPDQYHRVQKDFANSKQYLTGCIANGLRHGFFDKNSVSNSRQAGSGAITGSRSLT